MVSVKLYNREVFMYYITPQCPDHFRLLKKLYVSAFPRNERKPFSMIRRMFKKGKSDIWIFFDDGLFLGFAITINSREIVLIDYFAVNNDLRGKGYGSRMLNALLAHYSPRGVFLEIEIPYEGEDAYTERIRRKRFYLNVGLTPMNTRVKLFGVDMELMGYNCFLDYQQYRKFYLDNYSKYVYKNIKQVEDKD